MNISIASTSRVAYHYTDIFALLNILSTDSFALSLQTASTADGYNNYHYYMSLVRTRLGHFHVNRDNFGAVLLTLDGDKLNQFKIDPIDYWGPDFRDNRKGAYEQEDRLFCNDANIYKARTYIKRIDLLVKDLAKASVSSKTLVRKTLLLSKKYGIPIFCYATKQDWLLGRLGKAIILNLQMLAKLPFDKTTYTYSDRTTTKADHQKQKQRYKTQRRNLLQDAIDLDTISDYRQLSNDAQGYARRMEHPNTDEFIVLKQTIREYNEKPEGKVDVDAFIKHLRKRKLTLQQFFDHIKDKWIAIIRGYR